MPDRLQKIIAAAGVGSRRKAEEWILEGRVSVDGQVVTSLGTKADPVSQRIELNGRPIPQIPTRKIYIALHKPRGYASTLADAHAAHLITELVTLPGKPMMRPVGRLDIDTEGLIFLTDDGDFVYHMTHPKFEIEKQYVVTVRGTPSKDDIERLVKGVRIDDGSMARADHARLTRVFPGNETADIEIVLHAGRNRIIRRMCSAVGLPVARLVRTRIAFVTIGAIPAGGWRHLTASEVKRLMTSTQPNNLPEGGQGGSAGLDEGVDRPGDAPLQPKGVQRRSAAARPTYRRTARSGSKQIVNSQHAATGEKKCQIKKY